jgi:hypothetical protein
MLRSIAVSTLSLALLAAASAAADPAVAPAAPPTAASSSEAARAPAVKEVTLDPTKKPPVCRRYAPTGSRISTERCKSADAATPSREAEREQTRRDINEMRMRQAMREQARTQALAEAMRQRGR